LPSAHDDLALTRRLAVSARRPAVAGDEAHRPVLNLALHLRESEAPTSAQALEHDVIRFEEELLRGPDFVVDTTWQLERTATVSPFFVFIGWLLPRGSRTGICPQGPFMLLGPGQGLEQENDCTASGRENSEGAHSESAASRGPTTVLNLPQRRSVSRHALSAATDV